MKGHLYHDWVFKIQLMSNKFDTYFLNSAVPTEVIVSSEGHNLRWSGNCCENMANFPQLQATGMWISLVSILRICFLSKGTLFGGETTKYLTAA